MKSIVYVMVFCFLFAVSTGCERMETAVDTYTKVKKDAQQKSEEARNEAKKIVDEKLKKIDNETLKEVEEDGNEEN